MKKLLIISFLLLIGTCGFGQTIEEREKELQDSLSILGTEYERYLGSHHGNKKLTKQEKEVVLDSIKVLEKRLTDFHEYATREINKLKKSRHSGAYSLRNELLESLTSKSDSVYIMDRKLLENLTGHTFLDSSLNIDCESSKGDKIEIKIETGTFNKDEHSLELADTVFKNIHNKKRVDYLNVKNLIDGRYSYGIDGGLPTKEITSFAVTWDDDKITIPDSAFSNLYEPHICTKYSCVEVYLTNNNFLFIYMNGSDGAGGYSVKFVFDKTNYLTRIISTNEMTDGFNFIDGTVKLE